MTFLCLATIGIILTFDSGYRVAKDIARRENHSRR
jgi:hypothetical protein